MPDQPISDHADVTREQLQGLVDRMKADGRIPRTGAHYVSVVTPPPTVRREAYRGKVRCETCKGTGWTLCGERFCEHCHCPDCNGTGCTDA